MKKFLSVAGFILEEAIEPELILMGNMRDGAITFSGARDEHHVFRAWRLVDFCWQPYQESHSHQRTLSIDNPYNSLVLHLDNSIYWN